MTTVFFWPNATVNSFYHPKAAVGLLWLLALLSVPVDSYTTMRNPWVRRLSWWILVQFGVLYVMSGSIQQNLLGVPFGPWTIFPTLLVLGSLWFAEKAVRSAAHEDRWVAVANALCLSGLVVILVGWAQFFGIDQFEVGSSNPALPGHNVLGTGRASSTFGNTMVSMGYLGLVTPLYLVFRPLRYRVAFVLAMGLLAVSGAAMGLVAAVIGSLVVLLLTRQWWFVMGLGVLSGAGAWWKLSHGSEFFSITARPLIWQYVLDAWKPVGWTGRGLGAVGHEFSRTKVAGLETGFEHAHNDFLQGVNELGLIGWGLCAAMVGWTVWKTFKAPLTVLQAGWLGVIASYAVVMGFGFPHAIFPCTLAWLMAWAGLEWSIAQEGRDVSA